MQHAWISFMNKALAPCCRRTAVWAPTVWRSTSSTELASKFVLKFRFSHFKMCGGIDGTSTYAYPVSNATFLDE
eukprot:932745-Amphidinium_carterae.2